MVQRRMDDSLSGQPRLPWNTGMHALKGARWKPSPDSSPICPTTSPSTTSQSDSTILPSGCVRAVTHLEISHTVVSAWHAVSAGRQTHPYGRARITLQSHFPTSNRNRIRGGTPPFQTRSIQTHLRCWTRMQAQLGGTHIHLRICVKRARDTNQHNGEGARFQEVEHVLFKASKCAGRLRPPTSH